MPIEGVESRRTSIGPFQPLRSGRSVFGVLNSVYCAAHLFEIGEDVPSMEPVVDLPVKHTTADFEFAAALLREELVDWAILIERIEALPIESTQKQRLVSRVRARAPKTPGASI